MSYRVKEVDSEYITNKVKKDKSSTKFPKVFKTRVEISKVNFPIVKEWITSKLNEQLPDDDIVIDYLCELLQNDESPDIKGIHLQMQDFLGKEESLQFCEHLWRLLISAQEDADGIPLEIIEQRRKELEEIEKKQVKRDESSYRRSKTNYNRSQDNTDKRIPDEKERKYRERDNYRYRNSTSKPKGKYANDNYRDYGIRDRGVENVESGQRDWAHKDRERSRERK